MSVHVCIAVVLGHVLCMKRKNGFMDGCVYSFFYSDFV
jgi:hypothetical protein